METKGVRIIEAKIASYILETERRWPFISWTWN